MLSKGSCRNCKIDWRTHAIKDIPIYKSEDRWCKLCSGCGKEQCYTRMDHAKQSYVSDWQCKKCVTESKAFNKNDHIGDHNRMYNKFKNSALSRGIEWSITIDDMFSIYDGKCYLTGWDIYINYSKLNASLDRIDSSVGYIVGNIQWVHSMVNMSKNKYNQDDFIKMCKAVADRVKW